MHYRNAAQISPLMPEIKGLQQRIRAYGEQRCCAMSKELVSHLTAISRWGLPRQDTRKREGKKVGPQEVEGQGKGRREEGTLEACWTR